MSRPALTFRALGVRRMPGITDGGWELDGLSPGVNVVWGPNGAGKTTTAGAMERLLWPAAARDGRARLDARLDVAGAAWRVEADGGARRWQHEGEDADAPAGIPPESERDRYRIALHELLTETDRGLAERVLHESAGGYDVGGAATALGFRRSPGHQTTLRNALHGARARVRECEDEQARLRDDERRLDALRREAAALRERAARQALCRRALERLDAREAEREAREALAAFPPELARVAGAEAEQLRALRAALGAAEERAREARSEIAEARGTLAVTGLPADGLPGDAVTRLAASAHLLQQLHDTRMRLEREAAGAREAVRAARAAVAGAVGDDRAASLALPDVEALLRFARDAEQHRAELRAADAELAWLAPGAGAPADPETLGRGRHLLGEWLRLPDGAAPSRARTAAIAGAVLAAVAGAALGLLAHPVGWALVAAAALLAWYALSAPGGDARRTKREEYGRLGLDAPTAWEPAAVAALVERLEARIAEARHEAARAQRRDAVEHRRRGMEARAGEIEARRAELTARLGLAPDTDEGAVAWLCQRVHAWQGAVGQLCRAEEELRAAGAQYAAAFDETERWLAPYTSADVATPADVVGELEQLRGLGVRHDQARARLAAAEARLRDAGDEVDRRRAECAALLARAGLPDDADARLEALCGMRPRFVAASEACVGAQQDAATAERRLRDTGGFAEGVLAVPRAALEGELAASREAAEGLARASEDIARLEERLRAARERSDLEEALARAADAAGALRDGRARDQAAAAGWILREYVERETRDRDRPAVFHHARGLFTRITRGRYRLEMSDHAPAEFRAVDSATGAGCALDELSRGTRVQLLLAVRVAFIETMENGARLPLVLDEALGNSDDRRADAIVDTVIEIARGGRQVFFLTARRDEAERWQARLRDSGVDHALVDLGEARRMARLADLPPAPAPTLRFDAVPHPGDRDHRAYGAELKVPPADAGEGGADGVHLWYLVDDPARLHRLLSLGAETWGGLRALVEAVGPWMLGHDAGGYPRMEALARGMERLLESRRVGRGRTVDSEALRRSGAISGKFMDAVEALRRQERGDANRFLAALDDLPRFRTDARNAFREFLAREGYLDDREPLDEAQVRIALLTALAPDLRAGHCTAGDVDRLLTLVPAPLAAAAGA